MSFVNSTAKVEKVHKMMCFLPKDQMTQNMNAISFIFPAFFETSDNFMIEGVENDTKSNKKFIKSRVNKVEDSYRSPLSQEFFPKPITNCFIPVNVTKVERNLNALTEEYVKSRFLNSVISSVFFSDFSTSHTMHFLIRKELDIPGEFIKKGFYQVRMLFDLTSTAVKKLGYLEYYFELEDFDKSKRTVQGTVFKDEDRKTLKTEKILDLKHFNYRDIGHYFERMESNFFQILSSVIYKMRPSLNLETKLSVEQRANREANMGIMAQVRKAVEGKGTQNLGAKSATSQYYRGTSSLLPGGANRPKTNVAAQ